MNATLLIALALVVYLIPTFVSSFRSHHNASAIFWLNVLLGWTFLGWVVALVWSMTAVQATPAEPVETPETHVRCPECKELVRFDAIKCKHCGCRLVPGEMS